MTTASLSNLRNYIVVARAEGLRVGTIAEAFIRPDTRCLTAIAVKGGLAEAERYVFLDDIELLGEDVLLIANVAAVRNDLGPAEKAGRGFSDLRNMPVGTAGGVVLGKLADIEVDAESGQVAALFLADGRAISVEAEQVTFGRDQIVLPAGSEEHLQAPDEELRGFLSKLFSQETVDDVTGKLRRAFKSKEPAGGSKSESATEDEPKDEPTAEGAKKSEPPSDV